jgi:hypothetical protein
VKLSVLVRWQTVLPSGRTTSATGFKPQPPSTTRMRTRSPASPSKRQQLSSATEAQPSVPELPGSSEQPTGSSSRWIETR